jgi:PKD repeat protein
MKLNYIVLLLAITLSSAVFGQTTVPALITSNQTWTVSGSPYLIDKNTYIDSGISVIVSPGVDIIFSNNAGLKVDGEFLAAGTASSRISISNAQIELSAKSMAYNDSLQRGALFQYCDITGTGSGSRAITVYTSAIRVDHCNFSDMYYGIYMAGSSSTPRFATITNNDMRGDASNYGYPIYTSGTNITMIVENNYFHDAYYLYLYGTIQFNENKVYNLRAVNFYHYGNASITCNKFMNMSNGVQLSVYAYGIIVNIDFSNNTLDSCGSTAYYPMFKLSRPSSTYLIGSFKANNNNFLTNGGTAAKVEISGSNGTPTNSDTLNFRYNYWGVTNSSTIATYITDYTDNIMIFGTVDHSLFLSAPDSSCGAPPCPSADFVYSSDGRTVTFSRTESLPSGYNMDWNFGDGIGHNENDSTISHTYAQNGTYVVCLEIYRDNGSICDTKCDTISVSASSTCQASFYYATDTSNLYNLYVINNSTGTSSNTQYSWSFGDGSTSNQQHPTHEYDSFGLYSLCLTIYDSAAGCSSTYCDSVGLDSNGIMLKREGFTITVLDEKDILSAPTFSLNANVKLFPNPSTGLVKLNINTSERGQLLTTVLTNVGQQVYVSENNITSSTQIVDLDLSNLPNGLYYVELKLAEKVKMERIVIQK